MEEGKKFETALREEKILAFWKERGIFEKSLKKEAPNGEFVFYDGPPFATGLPHYGHIVASVIKDVVPRFWTMRGYRCPRVWGWDCHGLPIENIVEKELGFKHKKEIKEYGIAKFNERCRERVLTYASEWEKIIPRIGRWADMKNAYRTMDKPFMESVWWVFKELWKKGLVYEDYRSMHICPRCETTLSQQEVAEGYKDVKDISVTVKFKVKNPEKLGLSGDVYLLAWTTTPWTLPGNVALAVGKDIEYVKVPNKNVLRSLNHSFLETREIEAGEVMKHTVISAGTYIMSKDFLWRNLHSNAGAMEVRDLFKDREKLKQDVIEYINDFNSFAKRYQLEVVKGSDLIGTSYEPLFDYYYNDKTLKNRGNGWKVYAADFITTDAGTGIAHEAPAFGADDWELLKRVNLPFVQHVNMDGTFKAEVKDFAGLEVKPIEDPTKTDVEIIKHLAHKGLLFSKEKIEHSYPHCWRCDTPLLNYATSSWFVSVTKLKENLLKNAKDINWSPGHIKDGRFGMWLKDARDWSVSRQRFWASVIPVWRCAACKKQKVFGSADELEKASGKKVDDLHKHIVDEVTVRCECGTSMRRIPDVLDTWFDSGSMPYGERHYPFEKKKEFENAFPAQFIAEGLDQTRAWFYYLHVLSGALFRKSAFQNVIVNGIVLAEDGKKMSKKLQNYPDPMEVVEKYGADALRLYLLSSPVMQAENLSFMEKGVDEIARKNIGRLNNVLEFYKLYFSGASRNAESSHVLDKWILARLDELVEETTKGFEAYKLDVATRPVAEFIDDLSVWYLRRSRERVKEGGEDAKTALATLRHTLYTLSVVMAPAAPFFAEYLFQAVKEKADEESVHLASWPAVARKNFLSRLFAKKSDVLASMKTARYIVTRALEARDAAKIKVRQPLASLTIPASSKLGSEYLSIIADEVNVKQILKAGGTILLDTKVTPELEEEGLVRELIRAIQAGRKTSGLKPGDRVNAVINVQSETIRDLVKKSESQIRNATNVKEITCKIGNSSPSTVGSFEIILEPRTSKLEAV